MAVINLKIGKNLFNKEATVEDTIVTLETIDKLNTDSSMSGQASIMIDYAVKLFAERGVTRDEVLALPSTDFATLMDGISNIINIINETDSSEDEGETKK